ncbi:MAG: ABC transporter ATP-binding protein, partial [Phototrophicaceae bacterium]
AVMVLDEPTAFLDLPRRAEIMQLLRHLAATTGRAILLSTHDLDLALRAADTLWLMAGRGIQVGAPEDLVLRGAFEAAFRADGVRFDRASGAFSVAVPRGQAVTVVGDGIAQHWTRHALTRTGYRVAEAGDSAMIRIEITNGDGDPCWQLHVDGHTSTHHSIAALIAALTPP